MLSVRVRNLLLAILAVAFIYTSVSLAAAEEDEDEPKVAPGLVAAFAQSELAQPAAVRIDHEIQFVWGAARPDLRVPAGPFVARWQGLLFTQAAGDYRFHI